jgi:hypothetical protein
VFQSGGYLSFTSAYREYGLHVQSDGSVQGLEWAPGANRLALIGDFSESPVSPYGEIDVRGPHLMCMFQSGREVKIDSVLLFPLR